MTRPAARRADLRTLPTLELAWLLELAREPIEGMGTPTADGLPAPEAACEAAAIRAILAGRGAPRPAPRAR